LFVLALFVALWLRRPDGGGAVAGTDVVFGGSVFGTTYSVRVVPGTNVDPSRRRALQQAVVDTLESVDASMSSWRSDSELERFNHSGVEPFAASPSLLQVVAAATDISERSGGAFDVTVGPLVEAWGFGPQLVTDEPDAATLVGLRKRTGWRLLEIDTAAGTLRKRNPDVEVDLAAIAKGYAVDRVGAALEGLGEGRFLVEIGGEVLARGRAVGDRSWHLGIETPDPDRRSIHAVIGLEDVALATSGDYRSFRLDSSGRRLSHTIDPRTGRPVDHALASVSVVAPTCMEADAWATALNALGPTEGLATATREGLAVLFIERAADGCFVESATRHFAAYRAAAQPQSVL
jgi:thiamine biosynthesis lipoprotein